MVKGRNKEVIMKKKLYVHKLINLIEQYNKIIIFTCNNVGSSQLQDIRKQLRGKGTILMGKNVKIFIKIL
jgi:large subunit ribosomal protein LP0